jgi:hypothetical protein
MKIHEIVTEANLLGTGIEAGAKLLGKLGTKAEPELGKVIKNAGVIKEPLRKGVEKVAAKEPSWIEKGYASARKAKADKALAAQKAAMMPYVIKHYGDEAISLFKTLNLIDVAVEWVWEYSKLQKERATIGEEEYSRRLAELNGKKLLQWLAPKIAMGLANKAKFLVTWIPAIAKFAGFKGTAQLMRTIPAVVANGAFIAFFASPVGRKWVEDTFGGLISGVGKIPELLGELMTALKDGWDQGREILDKVTGGDEQGGKPNSDISGTSTGPTTNGGPNVPRDEYGDPIKPKTLGAERGNFSLGDVR